MDRSYVQYEANGRDFHFVLENGDKSFNYDSAETGLRSLVALVKDKALKMADFWEMRESILKEETISYSGKNGEVLRIVIGPTFIHPLREGSIKVVECLYPEEIVSPTFIICGCGEFHGRIYFKGGFTELCDSKEEAMSYLKYLNIFGYISDIEKLKVGEEIENSAL